MTKVMVFGAFDLLHPGHIKFFNDAKEYGDSLIVVVGRDSTIKEIKGKAPKYDENERVQHLKKVDAIDKIVLGSESDRYSIIEELMPDIICLGYDQNSFSDKLEDELKNRGLNIRVIRLRPYKEHKYKSSILKQKD